MNSTLGVIRSFLHTGSVVGPVDAVVGDSAGSEQASRPQLARPKELIKLKLLRAPTTKATGQILIRCQCWLYATFEGRKNVSFACCISVIKFYQSPLHIVPKNGGPRPCFRASFSASIARDSFRCCIGLLLRSLLRMAGTVAQ